MDERNKLLMKLTACKFAQYELVLFLDTHPNCVEAMQALNMHRANAIKLKDEYEFKYGPISNPKAPQNGCGCFTPSMGARNANCKKGACR